MKFLKEYGIVPRNLKLYENAFCHSSYCNENNIDDDYERLEFLGDAIVDLIVGDYLFHNGNFKEGKMTKLRASYVCENALYEYALKLDFPNYVKVGRGEELSGGKYKKAILADTFEALTAAIYLDLGFDTAKDFVLKVITPFIEDENSTLFNDYKSMLQELVQTDKKSLEYKLIDEQGPAHNKVFTMQVLVDNIVFGVGTASTKKEAEQKAAKDALDKQAKN